MENQTEITDLYSELSYDELKSVLEGWLNPNAEGERKPVSAGTLSQPARPAHNQLQPKAADQRSYRKLMMLQLHLMTYLTT